MHELRDTIPGKHEQPAMLRAALRALRCGQKQASPRSAAATWLQALGRDERGAELVGWVGMTVIVFFMVVGIWTAFFGGPGRSLKQEIASQVALFSNGFEGGLGTSGPSGGVPQVHQGKLPPPPPLQGGTIQGATIEGATMDGAQLPPRPALAGGTIQGATMDGAQLPPRPVLEGATMQGATMDGAQLPPRPALAGGTIQGATMQGAQLAGVVVLGVALPLGALALWAKWRRRRG